MKKEEKTRIIAGLQDKFTKAAGVILTDYKGLTVEEISDLREKLRDGSFEYRVVKNTLARRASEGTPVEAVKDTFAGPVGIAIGFDDPALLAKKVLEFAKGNEKLKVSGGIIEGRVCEADTIKAISELPSRETLLSTIVGTMQAPLSKLAAALNATMSQFAFAIMALKDKKSN
ncbi:MAG TPA: 50S ribosomal protein L10 [Nitrospirae bacterium]|nr:50S ribosomal protein L10 [Nitrospirota bacterium]HDK17363.1 50S ribosomal protein L10 [Nitrospirota bacterium]